MLAIPRHDILRVRSSRLGYVRSIPRHGKVFISKISGVAGFVFSLKHKLQRISYACFFVIIMLIMLTPHKYTICRWLNAFNCGRSWLTDEHRRPTSANARKHQPSDITVCIIT